MTINLFKTTILLLTSLFLTATANSAGTPPEVIKERWFQVEVIVFQRTDLKDLHAEEWPEQSNFVINPSAIDFLSPIPPFKEAKDHTETVPELLAPETEIVNDETFDSLIAVAKSELPFLPLQESFHQLTEQLSSIKRSSRYKLLKHMAWRQPTLGPKQAVAVRILGGLDFAKTYNADGSRKGVEALETEIDAPKFVTNETTTARLADNNVPIKGNELFVLPEDNDFLFDFETTRHGAELTDEETSPVSGLDEFETALPHVWELDGTIEITLRRYLHINLQLEMKREQHKIIDIKDYANFILPDNEFSEQTEKMDFGIDWKTTEETASFVMIQDGSENSVKIQYLQPYLLSQKRRVRSKEVHYFDHPLMGVLVLITPYDHQPEAELAKDVETGY